jgi:hypothetical protein
MSVPFRRHHAPQLVNPGVRPSRSFRPICRQRVRRPFSPTHRVRVRDARAEHPRLAPYVLPTDAHPDAVL